MEEMILSFYKRTHSSLPTLDQIYVEALGLPDFPKVSKTTLFRKSGQSFEGKTEKKLQKT